MMLQGSTALMAAAAWGHVGIVESLLTHGADAAVKTSKVSIEPYTVEMFCVV